MTMTVVFDVDGVILNYMLSFERFMIEKGICPLVPFSEERKWELTTMFPNDVLGGKSIYEYILEMNNCSKYFGNLSYINGAIESIKSFHNKGINIELLTSCGNSEAMKKLRMKNLKEILPYISKITILPIGANKKEFLLKYDTGVLFFDDYDKNCQDGIDAGLDVYRFKQGVISSSIKKTVVNWNDISNIVYKKLEREKYE